MAEIPERWKELHDYVSECFDADQKVPMARNQLFRLIEELGAAEAAVKKVLAALESVGRVTGDTFCWCPAQAWDCEDSDCIAARDAIRTGEKVLEGKG